MSFTGERGEGFPFNLTLCGHLSVSLQTVMFHWVKRWLSAAGFPSLDHSLFCASLRHLPFFPQRWRPDTFSLAWGRRLTQQKKRERYLLWQPLFSYSSFPRSSSHSVTCSDVGPGFCVPGGGWRLKCCREICKEAWAHRGDTSFLLTLFACSPRQSDCRKTLIAKIAASFPLQSKFRKKKYTLPNREREREQIEKSACTGHKL